MGLLDSLANATLGLLVMYLSAQVSFIIEKSYVISEVKYHIRNMKIVKMLLLMGLCIVK